MHVSQRTLVADTLGDDLARRLVAPGDRIRVWSDDFQLRSGEVYVVADLDPDGEPVLTSPDVALKASLGDRWEVVG